MHFIQISNVSTTEKIVLCWLPVKFIKKNHVSDQQLDIYIRLIKLSRNSKNVWKYRHALDQNDNVYNDMKKKL